MQSAWPLFTVVTKDGYFAFPAEQPEVCMLLDSYPGVYRECVHLYIMVVGIGVLLEGGSRHSRSVFQSLLEEKVVEHSENPCKWPWSPLILQPLLSARCPPHFH